MERFDLVDDGVSYTCRGGLCNVEVAEKLSEAVAREGLDDVCLPPPLLPVHVQIRKVDDAHEDVHCDEQPYLLRTRSPPSRCLLGCGVQIGVGCDGGDQRRSEEALQIAHLGPDAMTREVGARMDR